MEKYGGFLYSKSSRAGRDTTAEEILSSYTNYFKRNLKKESFNFRYEFGGIVVYDSLAGD